jgi:hypothetical protein
MEITLKLTVDQVNGIIYALGELPVKSGAGHLITVISQQAQPQLPEQTDQVSE